MTISNNSPIQFNNLKWAIEQEREEIDIAIRRVLDNGNFILGPEVEAFEYEMAQYMGAKYAISCASGTDALILALLTTKRNDGFCQVLTVANSAPATVAAILKAGLEPRFVDILPNGLMDHTKVKKAITDRTLAIMPVNLYGQVTKPIIDCYDFNKAPIIIEDGAQAVGSEQFKRSQADMKCVSFYPTKNLGALGDGGMILTYNSEKFFAIKKLRNYGLSNKTIWYKDGFNSRLDELQAAILRVRLKYLDENNKRRRQLADLYTVLLPEQVLHREYRNDENYHLFTIRTQYRDRLQEFLKEKNIDTIVHYPRPAHSYPVLRACQDDWHRNDLQETENFCREVLSLPMWPGLTLEEVSRVSYWVSEFFNHL